MIDPYDHSFIETNGIRLHVVTAGDPHGQPVILLHGFPEFWYGWRHQIDPLAAAGHFVIVPDQRGYNLSDKPGEMGAYKLQALVADVIGLMDHFNIGQANLVGHDWGAAVAWETALVHPGRIQRLGILNVPHPAVMWEFLHTSVRQMLKSWYIGFFQIPLLPAGLLKMNHCAPLVNMVKTSGNPGTFTRDELQAYRRAWSQPGALPAMINWYRAAFADRSRLAATRRIKAPVLILWGKKDIALDQGMAVRSIEYCDHGQLIFYENSTHWVQHDEAAAVNRELIGFLQAHTEALTEYA